MLLGKAGVVFTFALIRLKGSKYLVKRLMTLVISWDEGTKEISYIISRCLFSFVWYYYRTDCVLVLHAYIIQISFDYYSVNSYFRWFGVLVAFIFAVELVVESIAVMVMSKIVLCRII